MIRRVARQYRKAFSGLPLELWYLAAVILVNRAGSMVLPFLSLYVSHGLGLGDKAAGWMLATYGVGSCFGAFIGGMIASKVGPFQVQFWSLILSGIGYLLMAQVQDFYSLAVVVLLTSFVADTFRPANAAAVTLLAPPEVYKRAFSLNRLAINLGYSVGPAVGGLLATISYQFLFWIDGITCWIAAATFAWFLGFRSPQIAKHADSAKATVPARYSSPLRNWQFVLFLWLTFITFCVFFQLISTFPLFLQKVFKLSEFEIGTLLAFNTLVVVAFEMVLIQMLEQKRLMRLIAWGSFLMCFGFGLLPLGVGYWFALATVLVWTVGEMLAMPQMLAYVAQVSNPINRSAYMGYYTTCVALALMVGPLVGTALLEWDNQLCWHAATIVGLVALVGFYYLDRVGTARYSSEPQPEPHQLQVQENNCGSN